MNFPTIPTEFFKDRVKWPPKRWGLRQQVWMIASATNNRRGTGNPFSQWSPSFLIKTQSFATVNSSNVRVSKPSSFARLYTPNLSITWRVSPMPLRSATVMVFAPISCIDPTIARRVSGCVEAGAGSSLFLVCRSFSCPGSGFTP